MGCVEAEDILVTAVREQFAAAESRPDPYMKGSTSMSSVAAYASREEAKRLLRALVASKAGSVTKQDCTSAGEEAKLLMGSVEAEDKLVRAVREQFAAAESKRDPCVKGSTSMPSVAACASREEGKCLLRALVASNAGCVIKQACKSAREDAKHGLQKLVVPKQACGIKKVSASSGKASFIVAKGSLCMDLSWTKTLSLKFKYGVGCSPWPKASCTGFRSDAYR